MNFPRGEGGMTDGSRADRSTAGERASGRQRDVQTREGQADLSGDTREEAAELRNLPSSAPGGQVFPVVLVVVSSSSPRSPTRDRVRNAGAKWLNSELTRRSEINVGLPACHSTRRSAALILLLHNNNRLISPALTSKREGKMRRSERHLSSMR